MKKSAAVVISARLMATVTLLSSTALAVPAAAYSAIAGDAAPIDFEAALDDMRIKHDNINHMANELIGTINDQHLADPIALDSFDHTVVGQKFKQLGYISDTEMFTAAAAAIENDGFAGYVEDAIKRMSAVDQVYAAASAKLSAWASMSEADRDVAVINNTDDNIMPALAQMQTAMTQFTTFIQAGVMIFAEASYQDNPDASSLIDGVVTGQTADTDRELAVA